MPTSDDETVTNASINCARDRMLSGVYRLLNEVSKCVRCGAQKENLTNDRTASVIMLTSETIHWLRRRLVFVCFIVVARIKTTERYLMFV